MATSGPSSTSGVCPKRLAYDDPSLAVVHVGRGRDWGLTGPGDGILPGCDRGALGPEDDSDLDDFSLFQSYFTGPGLLNPVPAVDGGKRVISWAICSAGADSHENRRSRSRNRHQKRATKTLTVRLKLNILDQ